MQDTSLSTAIYVILLSAVAFMYSRIRAIEAKVEVLASVAVDMDTVKSDVEGLKEALDAAHRMQPEPEPEPEPIESDDSSDED